MLDFPNARLTFPRLALSRINFIAINVAQLISRGHQRYVRCKRHDSIDSDLRDESWLVNFHTENVDINAKSITGRPPILKAAAQGHEGIVRLSLEAGADRSLEDIDGKTPLSMAKKNGHDKIVKMLSGG